MRNVSVIVCMVLLGSCASAPVHEVSYKRIAEELVTPNYCEPQYCAGDWYPIERPESEEGTEIRKASAVTDCVTKLESNIQNVKAYFGAGSLGFQAGRAPNDIVAAAQIVACMKEHGWQYYVYGYLVSQH